MARLRAAFEHVSAEGVLQGGVVVVIAVGVREAEPACALVRELLRDRHQLVGILRRRGDELLVVDERDALVVERQPVDGAFVGHRLHRGRDEPGLRLRIEEEVDGLDGVARLDPAAQPVLGVDEDVGALPARHRRRNLVGECVVRHREGAHFRRGMRGVVGRGYLLQRRFLPGAVGMPHDDLGRVGGDGDEGCQGQGCDSKERPHQVSSSCSAFRPRCVAGYRRRTGGADRSPPGPRPCRRTPAGGAGPS